MRRTPFHKSFAALLVLWYLFAVTGFDVHCCYASGNVYIEPLVAGISCEDIHPDEPCCQSPHCCCGCHSDEGDCDHCEDCIYMLVFSGDGICPGPVVPEPASMQLALGGSLFDSDSASRKSFRLNWGRDSAPPRAELQLLCILRV